LREAFEKWAATDHLVGSALGDAMASAARREELPLLPRIAGRPRTGATDELISKDVPEGAAIVR